MPLLREINLFFGVAMLVYCMTDNNETWTECDNPTCTYFSNKADLCSAIVKRLKNYRSGSDEMYFALLRVSKIELSKCSSQDDMVLNLLNHVHFAASHENITSSIVERVQEYRKAYWCAA